MKVFTDIEIGAGVEQNYEMLGQGLREPEVRCHRYQNLGNVNICEACIDRFKRAVAEISADGIFGWPIMRALSVPLTRGIFLHTDIAKYQLISAEAKSPWTWY